MPKAHTRYVNYVQRSSRTGCIGKNRVRPRKGKNSATLAEEYRREEWAFLKEAGVSIHEAARRLGVTVQTLEGYDR